MGASTRLLAGLAAADLLDAVTRRRWQRQRGYKLAEARARETGKPFVVVGAPRAGWATGLIPTYGCGDLCIDLDGCASYAVSEARNVEDLSDFADDSAVLFVSCVLEYVNDIDAAVHEVERVAGRDLFVVSVPPWTTAHVVYPGGQRRILAAPMGDGRAFQWQRLPWRD